VRVQTQTRDTYTNCFEAFKLLRDDDLPLPDSTGLEATGVANPNYKTLIQLLGSEALCSDMEFLSYMLSPVGNIKEHGPIAYSMIHPGEPTKKLSHMTMSLVGSVPPDELEMVPRLERHGAGPAVV